MPSMSGSVAHAVEGLVATRLGPLHVRQLGSGPVAVLWHSLFVDSTTWQRVQDLLAEERRLLLIDGPGHGRSRGPRHRYTLDDCAAAACDVLSNLGVAGPVDWVGNAWGGHVGILFAAGHPERCRSLVVVAAPVQALGASERRRIAAGRVAYRAFGPGWPLVPMIRDAVLGPDADPAGAEVVAAAFRRADRRGMSEAIRSVSLERPDLRPVLSRVQAPTLFVAAQDDPLWSPAQSSAAAAQVPLGRTLVVPGRGHLGPLLDSPTVLATAVTEFWREAGSATSNPVAQELGPDR
jgi:pimeloyl-ACP methyl ester carboxylesterase